MILALVLILVNVYILLNTKQPENLRIVRERYQRLRDHIRDTDNEEFAHLCDEIPITAHLRAQGGSVGYNINKGHEIGICIDGDPNEIMHVLIHELAHNCVDEYAHSSEFWEKYDKIKNICIELGIYEEITKKTEFCGKHVQDK